MAGRRAPSRLLRQLDGEAVWGDQTLVGAELEDEGHRLYVNDKLYFADRATFLSS